MRNMQPLGGLIGDGTSPFKRMRFLDLDFFGFGIGVADRRAFGHLGWNLQPDGKLVGSGTIPLIAIRSSLKQASILKA